MYPVREMRGMPLPWFRFYLLEQGWGLHADADGKTAKQQDKKRKHKRGGCSVQELMGIRSFTRYGLDTVNGELLFFRIAPINISVLSNANIEIKIHSLQTALTMMVEADFSSDVGAAQALYILALSDHAGQPGFVSRLVSCFAAEQTDQPVGLWQEILP